MSLFTKKKCPVCEKDLKGVKTKIKDGILICGDCSSKIDIDSNMLTCQTVDNIKEHLAYREENQIIFNEFRPTRELNINHVYFRVDNDKKQWYFSFTKNPKNPTIYSFNDIIDYEISEDGETVSKGGLGSAVAGGLLFGGVGAIVGGVTGKKKTRSVIRNMTLRISLNHKYKNSLILQLIPLGSECKVGSFTYNAYKSDANNISSLLDYMCSNADNTENAVTENITSSTSSADELRKFKELLDDGIISQEEFDAKKKQLLGL